MPSNFLQALTSRDPGATPYRVRVSSPSGPVTRSAYAALVPAVVAAGLAVLVGLLVGHGAQAPLAGLLDPGAAVRWGLPFARTVHDLAAALTIGSLVLAAVALPEAARLRAVRLAAGAGIVWVGGLAVVLLLSGRLGRDLPVVVQRFSSLAGWCFGIVAVSGVVNAWLRLGGLGGLATAYGALVMIKVVALLLLGVAGIEQRQRVVGRLQTGPATRALFARLAAGELVVMGLAVGIAVALAHSGPPVPDKPLGTITPAQTLTGYPLPPPLDAARWFTVWRVDPLWLTLAVLGVGWYLASVRQLHRRGDAWPVLRVVSWVAGAAVLVVATSGPPGVYGRVLFSAHMLEHMTVSMIVPGLLVLGAPVTLALRTSTARRDGTRGWREWLLQIVHSRCLAVVGHPLVAAVIFMTSLVAFYYTPLFAHALTTHTGHVLMNLHFLLAGYLFSSVLMGIDPGVRRPAYPLRLLLLFATLSFHAFFGIALLSSTTLLAPDFYAELGRTWGASALTDQQTGGAVAWGVGELPTVLMALGVAVAWARSDEREARRRDRAADRDGDAELTAYNAALAARAARSGVPRDPDRRG